MPQPPLFQSLDDAETLRELVRYLREGLYVTDAEGHLLDASPAFLEMVGAATVDDVAGRPIEDLLVDPAARRGVVSSTRDGAVRELELTLLRADGGTASVNGFDVARESAQVRESISLTGQFAAVDEILTGRENLVLVARLRHLPEPRAIADELLARFALADAAARPVSTYSGGMRRRLDIAMSLIGDPPVIFLDEPTTGLDPAGRSEVWQSVSDLAANGTTVLLTTQYLDEAERLADRIAILHAGRILVEGTLGELRALLPPTEPVYVEQQPTLEEIYLAVVGHGGSGVDTIDRGRS